VFTSTRSGHFVDKAKYRDSKDGIRGTRSLVSVRSLFKFVFIFRSYEKGMVPVYKILKQKRQGEDVSLDVDDRAYQIRPS
jgi:hypothetical protein